MRRAPVLVSVSLAALLGTGLTFAAATTGAPPSVSIGEVSRTSVEFDFHRGPFLVYVEMEGPGNRLALNVIRHGASADYLTKPHFEGRTVRARFGRFGSLDLTFTPTPGKVRRCESIVQAQGVFRGRFEFIGENRYIHFDIRRVRGEHTTAGSCSSGRAVAAFQRPRAAPGGEERGVTLRARAPGPGSKARDTLTAIAGQGVRGFEAVVAGYRWEHEGGLEVIRGGLTGIGRNRFKWDLDAGTATLRPPAPFTGSATLGRSRDGTRRWSGSLRVPILGGRPLALTGPRYNLGLRAGSPID